MRDHRRQDCALTIATALQRDTSNDAVGLSRVPGSRRSNSHDARMGRLQLVPLDEPVGPSAGWESVGCSSRYFHDGRGAAGQREGQAAEENGARNQQHERRHCARIHGGQSGAALKAPICKVTRWKLRAPGTRIESALTSTRSRRHFS